MNLARLRNPLILASGIALLGAVGYGLAHRPSPVILNMHPPQPTALPTPTTAPTNLHCHILGAVRNPGVYTLPPGALIRDAVQAAGGLTPDADLERLNLAAAVQDHEQIIVPRRSTAVTPRATGAPDRSGVQIVDINTADCDTLETLPGIGPVLAQRILDYREQHGPFSDISELIAVKGIGEKTMDQLRPIITVGP
jgi:competence protein ComEA